MPASSVTRRGAVAALLGAPAIARQAPPSAKPPNFVFLISDDHSAPDLGCYGNAAIHTPNLDRMAAGGMRFDRCFVSSPQCSPNRASILTGCSPHTTPSSRIHGPMPDWEPSIVDWLKQRGYHTGAFRKVHQGAGFDKRWNFYGGAREPFTKFFDSLPAGKPFYLHVGFTDPHRPYAKGAFQPPHDPKTVRLPGFLPDTPEVRADLADYADEIARMDAECGQVLELLKKRGLDGDTLVLFTGDNGMPFPPKGKGTLYEHGIHVPLIARWPGRIKPGQVSRDLIAHVDLPSTWLDAAGIPQQPKMQGRSFLNLLLGRPYTPRAEIFSERNWHGNFDLCRAVRTDRYKLIFNALPRMPYRPISDLEASPSWESIERLARRGKLPPDQAAAFNPTRPTYELYDLDRDPLETENLVTSPRHAPIFQDLLDRLNRWMHATYDFVPPPCRSENGGPGCAPASL